MRRIGGSEFVIRLRQHQRMQPAAKAQRQRVIARVARPGEHAAAGRCRFVEHLCHHTAERGGERRAKCVASLGLVTKMRRGRARGPRLRPPSLMIRPREPILTLARRPAPSRSRAAIRSFDRFDRQRADMLGGDLAVLADDERLGHAVDAPVDCGCGRSDRRRSPRTGCRARPGISGRGPAGPCSSSRRARSGCRRRRPSSSGCSSRHGAHHDAQTLSTVTLPLNSAESRPGTLAPSSGASLVAGAGWPINADGISAASRPDIS